MLLCGFEAENQDLKKGYQSVDATVVVNFVEYEFEGIAVVQQQLDQVRHLKALKEVCVSSAEVLDRNGVQSYHDRVDQPADHVRFLH